jgi:hypothetical protein
MEGAREQPLVGLPPERLERQRVLAGGVVADRGRSFTGSWMRSESCTAITSGCGGPAGSSREALAGTPAPTTGALPDRKAETRRTRRTVSPTSVTTATVADLRPAFNQVCDGCRTDRETVSSQSS